jgi:hypothetical protein
MRRAGLTKEVVPDPCTYNTTYFLAPPSLVVETLATANVETGPKLRKQRSRQTLHEDVRKVEVDLDMLPVLALNGVG